jgi:hypothetical protein
LSTVTTAIMTRQMTTVSWVNTGKADVSAATPAAMEPRR